MKGGADQTARREAWRQFLHGTVQPLADIFAEEFRGKLHPAIRLTFEDLFASDLQGRARAFQSLVGGGMELERAAAASGLLTPDE